MATYFHIIFFSLIGGVLSLIGGVLLMRTESTAKRLAKYATPFAAGALLAAVFLDLLKEGVELTEPSTVMTAAIVGILLFFFAERALHWFHHHHEHKHAPDPTTGLIIAGDTIHNALDGVAIAAAFLVSVPTGIVTTLAVAAHEIPQEIGDFGLLLHKGLSRKKVLLVNLISALATVIAAVLTFWLGSGDNLPIGVLLGLSAGFLLYIAMSDVIPEIHEHSSNKRFLDWQPLMLLLGVILVGLVINLAHGYIDTGHDHEHDGHSVIEDHNDHDHEVEKVTLNVDEAKRYRAWYQPESCIQDNQSGIVAYDMFGPQQEQEQQARKLGCEGLDECDPHMVTIEGDYAGPCFAELET